MIENVSLSQKGFDRPKNRAGLYAALGLGTGIGHYVFNKKIDRDIVKFGEAFKKMGPTPELEVRLNKLAKLNKYVPKVLNVLGAGFAVAAVIALVKGLKADK